MSAEKNVAVNTKQLRALGWSAMVLLALGCISMVLVYLRTDVDAQTVQLAAGTGVLFAFFAVSASAAGILRLQARVERLEAVVAAQTKG